MSGTELIGTLVVGTGTIAVFFGAILVGERVYLRSRRSWLGWLVGLAIFFGFGAILMAMGEAMGIDSA